MKRYQWRPALEAKHAALEREANALLRADVRRQRAAARRPKPTPSPPSTISPTSSPTGWLPLTDLRRALRTKEFRQRARRQISRPTTRRP